MDDLERHRDLEELRQRFVDGDQSALLKAMYRSLMVRKTFVPQWLSDAFVKAYEDVCSAKAGSWDDVFGRPHPKGTHLEQLRDRWSKALPIWQAVETARSRGEKVDDGLFGEVGKQFGVSKTVANQIYYAMKNADDAIRAHGHPSDPDCFLPPNL